MHYVLRRFRDRNAEYEDLFQYGCMGLLKAIDRFDPAYGVRFSTYAVPMILGEVRRFLRDSAPVHLSRSIRDNALRIQRQREEYLRLNGCEPSVQELAQATGLDEESLLLAINALGRVRSLDEPVGDGEAALMDSLGSDDMDAVDSRLTLAKLLRDLPPEERRIIIRRYFRRHTQSEIARDMGVSQVQVSRMESRILKRMRQNAGEG